MKRLLAMVLVGVFSASASAADWVDLGVSKDGELRILVDFSSISPSDIRVYDQASSFSSFTAKPRYYSYFVKFEYIDPEPQDTKYILSHWHADCKGKASYIDQSIEYDSNYNTLNSYKSDDGGIVGKKAFNYAFPNTIAGRVLEETCEQVGY